MRYFIDFSYQGTNYHGWQIQDNAISVQEVIEQKIAMLFKSKIEITASGRTDTGVHAEQQLVHFDTDNELNESFLFRINCVLPKDISANAFYQMKPEAHARFDAIYREYEYRIATQKNPFLQGLSWQYSRELNLAKMQEAASLLLQYKDFQCFSKVHTDVAHFGCDITKATWHTEGNLLIFTIRANRFLRGMVRAIVGSLIDVGLEKSSVQNFEEIIRSKSRQKAGAAAPPEGLFLTKVVYPEEIFLQVGPEPKN